MKHTQAVKIEEDQMTMVRRTDLRPFLLEELRPKNLGRFFARPLACETGGRTGKFADPFASRADFATAESTQRYACAVTRNAHTVTLWRNAVLCGGDVKYFRNGLETVCAGLPTVPLLSRLLSRSLSQPRSSTTEKRLRMHIKMTLRPSRGVSRSLSRTASRRRSELTEAEEAQCLAKRKELWETREASPNSGKIFSENKSRGRPSGFAAETAALWETRETANNIRSFEGRGNSIVQTSDNKIGVNRRNLSRLKAEKVFPVSGGRGNKGFAAETATITGKSKQSINQKIARAQKIEPEVLEEVKGTDLDKGTVLDEIAKAPRDQQRAKIIEIRERQVG